MMKVLGGLLGALMIPLMLLSSLGGLVSAVWLAVLGDWQVVISGILLLAVGYIVVLMILSLPYLGLGFAGVAAFEKGWSPLGYASILLANVYMMALEIAWSVGVFLYFGERWQEGNGIPLWIWTFVVATGLWTTLAQKEYQSNPNTVALVSAAINQVAFLVLSATIIWFGWSLTAAVVSMIVLKLFPVGLSLMVAAEAQKQQAWQRIGQY